MTDERFQELLEDYADGTIDEAGSRDLMAGFGEDPKLKEHFVSQLRVANALHGLRAMDDSEQRTSQVLDSIRLAKGSPDISESVITELRSNIKVVPFPLMRIGLAIAAAVAVVFALITQRPTAESVATLANATDAQWANNQTFSANEGLPAGMLQLEAGIARIDFATGVRVTLEGPARLELLSKTEVRLHTGNLAAHVPPAGVGFQVYTEKVDVTDLGTTFGVSISTDGSTDVEVFEGKVEVAPPVGDASGSVTREIILEGDAINIPGDSTKVKRRRLKPRSFRGWPVLFGVLNTGGRIKFVNAQAITNPSEVTDAENIIIFPERFHAQTKETVTATFTSPGTYTQAEFRNRSESIDLQKRRVHSYLLQFNPPFNETAAYSDQIPFIGEVTFDRPIIAVITDREQLIRSDPQLGKRRFTYPQRSKRGLEHGDSITLSTDRHTLSVDWLVMQALKNGMDQIRVIVDSAAPADPVSTVY